MSDLGYTNSQVNKIKENLLTAINRFEFLSTAASRFGELIIYQNLISFIPCGSIPQDSNGLAINKSMELLLRDVLVILEQYEECEFNIIEDDDNLDECETIFELIESLDVNIDYERIKNGNINLLNSILEKVNENNLKLVEIFLKIDNSTLNILSELTQIDSKLNNIVSKNENTINLINEIKDDTRKLLDCECNRQILDSLTVSFNNISNKIDALSEKIENISINTDEINFDYQIILNKIEWLDERVAEYHSGTRRQFYQDNKVTRDQVTASFNVINNELQQCCLLLSDKIDNIKFQDLIQEIKNSEIRVINAFIDKSNSNKSEIILNSNTNSDNLLTNIVNAKNEIISDNLKIQNIILARVDEYLNKEYAGEITVIDRNDNEHTFSYNGLGLDGLMSLSLQTIEIIEQLHDTPSDLCETLVLIYSEREPHASLKSQLEIKFIPENVKRRTPSTPVRSFTVFSPKLDIDWCRDIEPIKPESGTEGWLTVYFGNKYDWTGGGFSDEKNAIDTANKLMRLTAEQDPYFGWTIGKIKRKIISAKWKPIIANMAIVKDGEVKEVRCFQPPKDGC